MQTEKTNTRTNGKPVTGNDNGNAISQRPGSDGVRITDGPAGLTPWADAPTTDGPVERDALANALADGFERQGPSGQAQPDGQNEEQNQPNETGQTTEAEEQAAAETEETLEAPEADTQTGTENEEGRTEGGEGQETEAEAETETDQDSPGIKKRIGKLQGKIEELERKLAEATAKPEEAEPRRGEGTENGERSAKPSPLDAINNPAELDRREDQTEQALEECETWLARLQTNPARVEKYLRENGIKLQDGNGEEDYTPDRMADTLVNWKSQLRQTLKGIPKRREFIQQHSQFLARVVRQIPWMGDRTDDRYLAVQKVMNTVPGLKSRVDGEYWAACAVEGHMANVARGKKGPESRVPSPKSNGAVPESRVPSPKSKVQNPNTRPNTGGSGGSAAPRTRTEAGKVAAAKARVQSEGSRDALAEFLQARG